MQSGYCAAQPRSSLTPRAKRVGFQFAHRTPSLLTGGMSDRPVLSSAAAHTGYGLAGLGALAAQLAVLLDLATNVLGQGVNRVDHLGRGLAGSQGDALQPQR